MINRKLLLALGATAAALGVYATLIEPRWLRVRRTTLHLRQLPRPLEGLRIALLSDLHVGPLTPAHLVARAVRMTNSTQPDLIAITGDLVDRLSDVPRVFDHLAELRAPLGVYVVPGNHDHDLGIDLWHEAVAQHPTLTNLTNAAHVLTIGNPEEDDVARLCIAGVDDLTEGQPRLDQLPPPGDRDFTVLLAHQPDHAEVVRRGADRIDLVLSGHTHAGQVRLPGSGAIINSANRDDLYEEGVRRRPWTQVYTSAGIGTVHLPVRFLARPEIALLTLTSAPRPAGPRLAMKTRN